VPDCNRDYGGASPQATKESDPASACQSANPTQHYDKRSLRRLQERAAVPDCNRDYGGALQPPLPACLRGCDGKRTPAAQESADVHMGWAFHGLASDAREWHPGFQGGSWG
jgi:hypothetical protein